MFTGIIEDVGVIRGRNVVNKQFQLIVESTKIHKVKKGSSVNIDGVCLTVAGVNGKKMMFDVMEETMKKTTLGKNKVGDRVNVERALRIGDELGGHFVFGHVSAVAEILNHKPASPAGGSEILNGVLTLKPPRELMKYIVPQGSVAIDGVSLTVARVEKNNFTVALVDYTLKHTTLGKLKKRDRVNIEIDMLAKYTEGIINDKR